MRKRADGSKSGPGTVAWLLRRVHNSMSPMFSRKAGNYACPPPRLCCQQGFTQFCAAPTEAPKQKVLVHEQLGLQAIFGQGGHHKDLQWSLNCTGWASQNPCNPKMKHVFGGVSCLADLFQAILHQCEDAEGATCGAGTNPRATTKGDHAQGPELHQKKEGDDLSDH